MMKKRGYIRPLALIAIACLLMLTACAGIKERAGQLMIDAGLMAAPEITQVTLAVPVPLNPGKEYTQYIKGVELAVLEAAAMDLPVTLNIQIDYDRGDFSSAIELTLAYINDSSTIGVVGHWGSFICLPLANIYAAEQKTLIASIASAPSLTSKLSDYIFRNIPQDGQVSEKMCDYAKRQGLQKAVVYYEDSVYGFEMSAALEQYAQSIGIEIVDRTCSPHLERDLPELERKWRAFGYDTVFLISTLEEGVELINALRGLGFAGSIICSNGLDDEELIGYLDSGAQDLVVASTFNSERPPEGLAQFAQRYTEHYGTVPDSWAIQGYDSVMIVVEAVAKHGVRTSDELSAYLRASDNLGGIFGATYFDERHEIAGKPIYLKKLTGSRFEYID